VVYFYADWCPYCHTLDGQYLPSAPVQEYLRHVVKVRINPEHGPPERELGNRYGVTGYPTFLVMRLTSRVAKGRVDVLGLSYGGKLEAFAMAPNKSLLVMNIDTVGVMRQGFDGSSGWEQSEQSGLRTSTGASLTSLARDAEFYHDVILRRSRLPRRCPIRPLSSRLRRSNTTCRLMRRSSGNRRSKPLVLTG
jgi:thiol-disulfide isomerase/thioredoxin